MRPRTNVVTPDVCSLGSAYSNAYLRSARIPPLSTAVSESASASASSRARAARTPPMYISHTRGLHAAGNVRGAGSFSRAQVAAAVRVRVRPPFSVFVDGEDCRAAIFSPAAVTNDDPMKERENAARPKE